MPRAAQARRLVEDARAAIAAAVGARPQNVIFTSGGTEANALALTPGLRRGDGRAGRAAAGLGDRARLGAGGRAVSADAIATDQRSRARASSISTHLRALLDGGPPALVSVMLANNETGAIQPVAEVAEIVHAAGGLLHVDAIQALGKIPFDINALGADLLTLSAHKIGGPKGVGALVLAEGVQGLEPLLRGGGQELGRRAGTENVAGIAGFGAAAQGRHGGPGATMRPACKACGTVSKRACRQTPRYDRILRRRARGCPIPPCSRFPA